MRNQLSFLFMIMTTTSILIMVNACGFHDRCGEGEGNIDGDSDRDGDGDGEVVESEEGEGNQRLSAEGDSCTRTSDCEADLHCIDMVCVDVEEGNETHNGEQCHGYIEKSKCEASIQCQWMGDAEEGICSKSDVMICIEYGYQITCEDDSRCVWLLDAQACTASEKASEVEGEPWYDSSSGLTWQNPPTKTRMNWQAAVDYCSSLTFAEGGWRLPTIGELRTLIRGCVDTETSGNCGVND